MTVLRFAIRDRQKGLLWWMLGIVSLHFITVAFFPSIRDQQSFDEIVQEMPEALRNMFGLGEGISLGSAPGYLWSQLFFPALPALAVIYAIVGGAGVIGGSEEDGTLELLLANPISRTSLAFQRFLAIAALLAALTLFAAVSFVPLAIPFQALEGVSRPGLAAAFGGLFSLALFHASVAFAGGAITGRRGAGLGAGLVLAAGGFVAQGLLTAVDAPAWARNLNPWHWYLRRNLLAFGATWQSIVPAFCLAAFAVAAGIAVFRRRDLG